LRVRLACLISALIALALTTPAYGQNANLNQEIQQSQRRLEQIREERNRLQRDLGEVQIRARDAAAELDNLERRLSATRSALAELEFQSEATIEQVVGASRDLVISQEQLATRKAILARRLRDIYKMGPTHTIKVLLGSRSFTDVINRYRYLQRIAAFDQSLVERVRNLEAALTQQNDVLRERMSVLGTLRQDRLTEVAELRSVEKAHQSAIQQYRTREQTASTRLEELRADANRMATLIDALEDRRRDLESRSNATLSSEDAGSLEWPVNGEVIYEFGRDRRPNGTVIRWNGIGISARTGTPVEAVKKGIVAYAGSFEGYGPTVMLSHGNGFYTLYLYLDEISVVEGREVMEGEVVGTVGGADTPEGAHLEFQVRAPMEDGSSPQAQDPLIWLRGR
jgi:septal ring factor EnvC (AmiA/AmiB activator)